MTDPLEQDVLSFLGSSKPPAPKPTSLEADVLGFLASDKPAAPAPAPPRPAPAKPKRDPILDRMPPALAADFEKRPEFAAKLAKDRAAGLTDDQILAKIQVGQQLKPKRPEWARNAPSTAAATNDALYGQPTGIETAAETVLRAGAGMVGTAGALLERTGRKLYVPDEQQEGADPKRAAAMAKMREIYSVGAPGPGTISALGEAANETLVEPVVEKGVQLQAAAERAQEAVPRPRYARDFMEGLKTDPLKTLAISGAENLPQLALTISAAAISPELGLGVAWAQETGGAYQEAKQRGATEDEAQKISGIVGATNMFLEYLPAGKALESLGGATRKGVKGLLYDMIEQAVAEGATESVQEANQMIVTAAMSAHDQGFTFDEFRDRVMEAGLSAMVLGGATGMAAHAGGSLHNAGGDDGRQVGGITLQTPRWASSPEDAFARLPEFIGNHQGVLLQASDLPFDSTKPLPVTRWEASPGAVNPDRAGGTFWLLGDSTYYSRLGDGGMQIGGRNARSATYHPVNPLIVVRPLDTEVERNLFRNAAGAGHDAVIMLGSIPDLVEIVTLPGAKIENRTGSVAVQKSVKVADAWRSLPQEAVDEMVRGRGWEGVARFSEKYGVPQELAEDTLAYVSSHLASSDNNLAPDTLAARVGLDQAQPASAPLRLINRTVDRFRTRDPFSQLTTRPVAETTDAELEADVLGFLDNQGQANVVPDAAAARKAEFADLAAASLAIGTSKDAEAKTAVEIVPGTSLGVNRQLLAVDQAGNEVGSLDYTIEPGGFRVHMIATGQRGSGAGRALMQAAAEDANGPMTGAASMTAEGEGFFRRVAQTNPELVSESVFEEVPDAGQTLAATVPRGGTGIAEGGIRDNGRGEGVVSGAAEAAQGELNALPAVRSTGAPEASREETGREAPVPEPAREPDRGPGSLPARIIKQRAGQEGFAVVPTAIKAPLKKWWRKRMTAQGLAPKYFLDLKVRRDGQLAAKVARLDAYSIDLARAIRRYKGPLTQKQLKIYLDDAYRGMNLSGISGPMDETQIGRFERRGRPAQQAGQAVVADLSEQSLQRLREDSPGSKFPREARRPDQSSIGRKQLREMASRQGVSEDALVSIARKEGGQSAAAAPEFLPLLREMRSIQDDLARTLRRYGLLDDSSIQQLEREFGLYVHRQYEAPRNPKFLKWVKNQPLWNRAYDLTKSLWDRQFAANRADLIVEDLHLRRPPTSGPFQQGEVVEIASAETEKKAPKPEGEEELTRAALAKPKPRPEIEDTVVERGKIKIKALQFLGSDGQQQVFEIRSKPGESRPAAEARTRAEAEARRDEMYPVKTGESLPSGRTGTIVQVKGSEVFVETVNEDGKRETVAVPKTRIKRTFGTKADAVADVRRTMMDPSTRDRFLDDYQIDAETFDESHAKAREAIPDMPESEILGLLQSYVEASGNRPVLPGGVPEGSKDLTALKRRGRKDDLERLLKGEVRSIDWNFLTTSLKMATIVAQHRFLVDLEQAGKGDIFTEKMEVRDADTKDEKALTKPIDPDFYVKSIETAKGREPGIDQRIIKRGSKKTAPLSGLFTTEEMMEALNEQFDFKSYPDWLKYYMRGAVMAKGAATAGSAISLARNVWSQPLVLMANGVNPLNIKRFLKAGMDSYPRAVGNTSRSRLARIERYVELGFVDQGADIGDIKRMEKRAQIFSDDIPHGAGSTGGRMIRETARGARNLYQAPDNQGKIQIFEALLPLYKKALPDLTAAQVEEHLAAKMRDTTQNYPMSPPLVKAISNFPFIAPFVTFRMEVIRNLYHAARVASEEVRSDNPELRKIGLRRAAGMSAALALPMATAFAARAWLNMDDDDDDATRRFMAPWNKNSTIAFLSGVDTEGNVKFIDLSFMDYYAAAKAPFEALLRGDYEGLASSITDPFGEDVLTKNVLDVTARGGQTKDGHDVYNKQDTTLTKSIAITEHLGAPLTPGVIKQVARTMDPERDKSSEIMGLFGVRKTVINIPKELRRQVKMYQDAINDSRWIEKKVIRKEGTEEVYSAAQKRSIVALRRNIEEFIKDIQAARQLGLTEGKIAEALRESGVGAGETQLLLAGNVEALAKHFGDLNKAWGEEKRNP